MVREILALSVLLVSPLAAHADDDDDDLYTNPPNEERHQISGVTFGAGAGVHAAGSTDTVEADTTSSVGLETRGFHADNYGGWLGSWDFQLRAETGANLSEPSAEAGVAGRIRFGMAYAPAAAVARRGTTGCDILAGARADIEGEVRGGFRGSDRFDGGMDAQAGTYCTLSRDMSLLAAAEIGPHAVGDAAGDDLQVRAGARTVLAVNDDTFLEVAGGRSLFSSGTYGEVAFRQRVADDWLVGTDITAFDRSAPAAPVESGDSGAAAGDSRTTNVRALVTVTRGF